MKRLMQIITFLSMFCNMLTKSSEPSLTDPVNNLDATNTNEIPNSINEFGYKLLRRMLSDKNDNVIISPTGISGVLAMTLLGTVGRTYEEIADALGFSHDIYSNRQYHDQFGRLLHQLNSESNHSKTLYVGSMFVDTDTNLRDIYRQYVHLVYRSNVFNVDFKDSVAAKNRINEWIKNNTEGKIDNFLKTILPRETKIVLLSALYFSGQWQQVFIPEFTTKMAFTRIDNSEIKTDFMLNVGTFKYVFSEKYGAQMVALPYNDSVTTLYILKPLQPKELKLSQLLASLNFIEIDGLVSQMTPHKCVIRMPKMEIQKTNKLETYLRDMGVKSIFEPQQANFGLMVDNKQNITQNQIISRLAEVIDLQKVKNILNNLPNPGIYVDTVLHDVKLSINEYGTEAVAVTAGILGRTAEQIYLDSPFYMFIRNEKTKLVTFSAAIFDPTE